MNKNERQPFIDAVDNVLIPLKFKRKKVEFEWNRTVDEFNSEWVHLNFGLGIINPSFGVNYLELSCILPQEINKVCGVNRMLMTVSRRGYNSTTDPTLLANDIVSYCLRDLLLLRDRRIVIENLKTGNAAEWPVFGYSARIRLLPLLLLHERKMEECYSWLSLFEQKYRDKDQMLPNYSVFASQLRILIAKCEQNNVKEF